MPFPDELKPSERRQGAGVSVHPYNHRWPEEAAELARDLAAFVPAARAVEHIGSTSIPGMAAKDCLDMMIVVDDLEGADTKAALTDVGYRLRTEPWNISEEAEGRAWPKQVFAPPPGARSCNIHVRTTGSGPVRVALLFRDHLRAEPQRTKWWSEFKAAAAQHTTSLAEYGQLKYPAWLLLMQLAESWARDTGWAPPRY